MYAKLLGFLLFACHIILNESYVTERVIYATASLDENTASQPSALPEGYVTFADVHAAYKLHEEGTSWNEARDKCKAEGARLAIADSVEKIQHINSLKTNKDDGKWVHIGIYQNNATNEWVRIDNDLPITSLPWAENNPDGSGNCTGISINVEGLVDYSCNWSGEYYACEIAV